jgi:hypothetical protein
MKRFLLLCAVLVVCGMLLSCASSYGTYARALFDGKRLLSNQEYAEARDEFLKAAEVDRTAETLAFAAVASYRLNDLPAAETYIMQASSIPAKGWSYLRIEGYKALILLKEGKKDEGLTALKYYSEFYGHTIPKKSIQDVERMWRKGDVDIAKLELLLDDQVGTYESDIEQYRQTGTGAYGDRSKF